MFAVAIKDVFGKWIAPVSAAGSRKRARGYAHHLLVEGWSNQHGEITAVQVVPWNGYDTTRQAVKAL